MWLTELRCDGTLVSVTDGIVRVRQRERQDRRHDHAARVGRHERPVTERGARQRHDVVRRPVGFGPCEGADRREHRRSGAE